MSHKIDLFRPHLGKEELKEVEKVFSSGWIGMGAKTKEFEQKFSEYIGVSHAVAVTSCTSALSLSLRLLGIGYGDEVIVPTITFIATAHAVVHNQAQPIFCDINPDSLLIDFDDVKRKITKRTKAIIIVHIAGRCVDVPALRKIVGNDIYIIEDCAHACGSTLNGKKAGSLGDIGCFSFHATKNLTTGDGGAIVSNNSELMVRAKKLSWLGIEKGTWERVKGDHTYLWDYDVDEIGLKCHMNDIDAAIGLVQLSKLDRLNKRRKEIASLYFKLLDETSVILPPDDTKSSKSSWHIFHIKADKRTELYKFLESHNIYSGVHYKPIHLYKSYGNVPDLPIAELVWNKLLSIPMHPALSDNDIEIVSNKIKEFYQGELQ